MTFRHNHQKEGPDLENSVVLRNVMHAASLFLFPCRWFSFNASILISSRASNTTVLYTKGLPDLERMATELKKGEDLISTFWWRYLGSEIHIWFKDEEY